MIVVLAHCRSTVSLGQIKYSVYSVTEYEPKPAHKATTVNFNRE